MRGAGGRAQYVSCFAIERVVRDGGPSAVEDAPRHRRVAACRSPRDVRCVGSCQWNVRAPTLRSSASTGTRGKCDVLTSTTVNDSNLFPRSVPCLLRFTPCSPFAAYARTCCTFCISRSSLIFIVIFLVHRLYFSISRLHRTSFHLVERNLVERDRSGCCSSQ